VVDTIRFAPGLTGKTIQLADNLGQIRIHQSVSINGLGSSLLKVSGPVGGEGSRIFNISGAEGALVAVTVQGLTLTNGNPEGDGGAILSQFGNPGNSLTLRNDVFTKNIAGGEGNGGAVQVRSGALIVQNCTFSANQAGSEGGGEFGGDGGAIDTEGNRLTIQDSNFSNNLAAGAGGAVSIYSNGPTWIARSNFANNLSCCGGGAIWFGDWANGNATISQSSLYGNVTFLDGGAIASDFFDLESLVTLTVQNTTISGNTSEFGGGGAIFWGKGTLNLRNVTITQNQAKFGLGGGVLGISGFEESEDLHVEAAEGPATTVINIVNSIIQQNRDSIGANDLLACDCTTFNVRYSLIQNVPPGTINGVNSHNIFNVAAALAPLGFYFGSKTKSQPPLLGSIAIGKGLKSLVPDLLVDQNGKVRYHGLTVDLGAVETGLGSTRRGA
jgi:hypothetical protein